MTDTHPRYIVERDTEDGCTVGFTVRDTHTGDAVRREWWRSDWDAESARDYAGWLNEIDQDQETDQ